MFIKICFVSGERVIKFGTENVLALHNYDEKCIF